MIKKTLIFILNAHAPYVDTKTDDVFADQFHFFELLSYGFLPLLNTCAQLKTDGVPFRFGLAISPLVCEMLANRSLQDAYIAYLDSHIAFKEYELTRCKDNRQFNSIRTNIEEHCVFLTKARTDFCERWKKNILEYIKSFVLTGHIELLATPAFPCFFPFYSGSIEALTAQIELGLESFRNYFSIAPSGFLLPAMGYTPCLEQFLRQYGIRYSVLESQSFLLAANPPASGVFLPAAAENGCMFFAKDCIAAAETADAENGMYLNDIYLHTDKDIGFDLDAAYLAPLFDITKGRRATGYAYKTRGGTFYDRTAAYAHAEKDAQTFLNNRAAALEEAGTLLNTASLCSVSEFPLQFLGRTWREGMHWFEHLFRSMATASELSAALPAAYSASIHQIQSVAPFYSSNLQSGYADELVNSKNDWMFFPTQKATKRMIDIAFRFPDESGLKERILNAAAREIMFAQSIDWPLLAYSEIYGEYAAKQYKDHISAFTLIYEALGSSAVNTEWLITREKRFPFFPELNYRLFLPKIHTYNLENSEYCFR